jgi:ectoine hydroxylase-related dioxygenase (phytanoyl-CoA dioxygenase family)
MSTGEEATMPIHTFQATAILDGSALQPAIQALKDDGIVVLENAVDLDHIAVLRDRWIADVDLILARPDRPFNWNPGNLQQEPPHYPPFLFRDVLVNEAAIAVNKGVLGPGLRSGFYSGNTALPSEHRQPVHADSGQLWPNLEVATPAYGIVVNLPLVDMSAENGSTEMWPGTHKDTSVVMQDGDIKVSPEALEKQKAIEPPVQPVVKAGSIVLRDLRMWHAGMPNRTTQPRPMLAMIHFVSWWPTNPIKFPKGTESLFEHPDLFTHAEFTEAEIDHIGTTEGFEFEEAKR